MQYDWTNQSFENEVVELVGFSCAKDVSARKPLLPPKPWTLGISLDAELK